MNNLILSNKDRDEIFYTFILPSLTSKLESRKNPVAHILGGQPAAGKSHFLKTIIKEDANTAIINGDDFRGYHPMYNHFLNQDERNASDLTQQDVNYWIEKAITEISQKRYSMIIEGTLRNADVPIKTAKLLKDAEYLVDMDIILVNPEISKVDMIKRYLLQKQAINFARFTKIEAHNETIDKIFSNILLIASKEEIDRVRLFRREIENYNLFYERNLRINPVYDEVNLKKILISEQKRELNNEELEYLKKSWENVTELSKEYSELKEYIKQIRETKMEYKLRGKEFKMS